MDKHIKVDPRVWKKAKELSQGDTKRLVVESPTSVLVLNHRKHK